MIQGSGMDIAQSLPQRRCISCRANGKKVSLLRFVAWGEALCFDCRKKAPGRGVYVCAQMHCLQKAWSGGFKRASKGVLKPEGELESYVRDTLLVGLWQRYRECLLVGRQNATLLVSTAAVESAARDNVLACYILASDASEATRHKYASNADRKGLACMGLLNKADLGQLLGKGEKSVLGWLEGGAYEEFVELESSIVRLERELSEKDGKAGHGARL